MLASVEERFDGERIVVVEESGNTDGLLDEISRRSSEESVTEVRRTIALSTAQKAAQHIARTVTSSAGDLRRLSDVVESVTRPRLEGRPLAVHESWYETELEVADEIERLLDELDLEIVKVFGDNLSSRILSETNRWQRPDIEAALAAWRMDTAARFNAAAAIRWRRRTTRQMIDNASWMVGVNPSVVISKRVRRVVGSGFGNMVNEVHGRLLAIADEAVESRVGDWRSSIEEAGSFKPGELLAAADALGRQ